MEPLFIITSSLALLTISSCLLISSCDSSLLSLLVVTRILFCIDHFQCRIRIGFHDLSMFNQRAWNVSCSQDRFEQMDSTDSFRSLGIEHWGSIPRITVRGDQLSGKNSPFHSSPQTQEHFVTLPSPLFPSCSAVNSHVFWDSSDDSMAICHLLIKFSDLLLPT